MKNYTQLTLLEREQLHARLWDKLSVREIARRLHRSPSTISREINRNTPEVLKRYTPHLAQEKYDTRKRAARERARLKDPKIVLYVEQQMSGKNFSPEQIAGRWNRKHKNLTISHEAIYQYIYNRCRPGEQGDLRPFLKRKHKNRRRKYIVGKEARTTIPKRISIEQRPAIINSRRTFGHWEGDSIVSSKSTAGLNNITERKSKLTRISKFEYKTAEATSDAVIKKLEQYPEKLRQSLTMDNGTENAGHEAMTEALGTKCYFAHPYRSSERGTNENTNGLIRYYFPKGTDFATVSEEEIQRVENLLNNRPRKCLNYQTPLEVFNRVCCG